VTRSALSSAGRNARYSPSHSHTLETVQMAKVSTNTYPSLCSFLAASLRHSLDPDSAHNANKTTLALNAPFGSAPVIQSTFGIYNV
jgi:hypothetical protein